LGNLYWSIDPWKHGRNKSLLYYLAKHSLTSNTLNMECDNRKASRVLRFKICPQSLVDTIDEWPNDNGIPVTVPKSLLTFEVERKVFFSCAR
jgi:hypothetical protein